LYWKNRVWSALSDRTRRATYSWSCKSRYNGAARGGGGAAARANSACLGIAMRACLRRRERILMPLMTSCLLRAWALELEIRELACVHAQAAQVGVSPNDTASVRSRIIRSAVEGGKYTAAEANSAVAEWGIGSPTAADFRAFEAIPLHPLLNTSLYGSRIGYVPQGRITCCDGRTIRTHKGP
jgi:hypothetical protein